MNKDVIVIKGHGAISSAGHSKETISRSYQSEKTAIKLLDKLPVAALQQKGCEVIEQLALEKKVYQGLDRSVLMAIYASRQAVAEAGWQHEENISINIGSSRGATALVEHFITGFNATGRVPANTSPVTTLGNISSWVAQDLNSSGAVISHSVTCSTGLQAIANGFAWLKSGMADKFLAGASEAPLTPYTIAQMKAIGIYTDDVSSAYPCRPFNLKKQNTFVLGEGAAIFALEKLAREDVTAHQIIIESVGFGFEAINSKTGISREGNHFKKAIENALTQADCALPVDMIIAHAPGTIAGDSAELNAINSIFKQSEMPVIISTKWITGHTLGASGCLSMDYAIHVLNTQSYPSFPYPTVVSNVQNRPINRILITAAGFGGNAMAVILSKLNET